LGVASERLGRLDDVLGACRRFLRLAPNDIEAHLMRLRAANSLRRADEVSAATEGAFKSADNVIASAPTTNATIAQSIVALARLLLETGEAEKALVLAEKALGKFGDDADLHTLRGSALGELMRPAEAIAAYDRALALPGRPTEALTYRGIALFQLGKFDEAIASYDRALQAGYGAPTVLINLVSAKKFESSADPHLRLIQSMVKDIERQSPADQMYLHFAAGKALNDLGKYDEAFAHWVAGNRLKRRSLPYRVETDVALADGLGNVLTADWLAKRLLSETDQTEAPIFVFGMPRSGTTLVEQLLAGHPDANAIGETGFFREALRAALKNRPASETYLDRLRTLRGDELAEAARGYVQMARSRSGSRGRRLVDKTLSTSHELAVIAAALPRALFIHVRRDRLDNALACFSNLFTAGHEFSYDFEDLATYRLSFEALTAHWPKVLPPGRLLEIDYESLVGDFEAKAKQTLDFCLLPWTPAVLDFSHVDRPVRSASAFQVRQGLFSSSVGRSSHFRKGLAPLKELFESGRQRRIATG
jgi:tetratricopeptide (TPR) repeat protein